MHRLRSPMGFGLTFFYIVASLFTSSAWGLGPADELLGSSLLSSPDSVAFVSSLAVVDTSPGLTDPDSFPGLVLNAGAYRTDRAPVFASFPGADAGFGEGSTVFLATLKEPSGSLVAFFALNVLKTRGGEAVGVIDYIMSPASDGLAKRILLYLRDEFGPAIGLSRLYAELEWAGREYWARPEFAFSLSDLQPAVLRDGEALAFDHLIRENFARFLREHDISPLRPFTWGGIRSPSDVRAVKATKRISLLTLRAYDVLKMRKLHAGPAFLLANHAPRPKQLHRIEIGGKLYSDAAMPPWFGVLTCARRL